MASLVILGLGWHSPLLAWPLTVPPSLQLQEALIICLKSYYLVQQTDRIFMLCKLVFKHVHYEHAQIDHVALIAAWKVDVPLMIHIQECFTHTCPLGGARSGLPQLMFIISMDVETIVKFLNVYINVD